jgi:DNA-directed RNA polymerase subunit RPC12/RpoP
MSAELTCSVCGAAVEEKSSAVCNACGERFHFNQRNDGPGKDCGAVWINDQYLALEFACRRCLEGDAPAPPAAPRLRPRTGRRRYRRRA